MYSTDSSGSTASGSVDLLNLKPGVSYIVQVQAVGGNNEEVSDWSTAYIFVVPNIS